MAAETPRPGRPRERGQVLVVFLLMFTTCMLLAIVAVSVGQMLVRRHQAQMVVDAAAFSGAAAQAKGLNTIARFNQKSLNLLRAIEYTKLAPFIDSDSTTWGRLFGVGALNDWAGDLLNSYKQIFKLFDDVINGVNIAYARAWPVGPGPWSAARETVQANFSGDAEAIFTEADLTGQGVVIDDVLNPARMARLVQLTEPGTYEINGYWYFPNPENAVFQACLDDPEPFSKAAACAWWSDVYFDVDLYFESMRWAYPIKYQLGRFYDNPEAVDVRFCYRLSVSSSPVLFGRTFFSDLPDIIVAAAAKPYGGYLGSDFEPGGWFGFYDSPSGKAISPTYKAKLVPLTGREKLGLAGAAVMGGEDPLEMRWLPTNVLH
jgi:hypothetical protein